MQSNESVLKKVFENRKKASQITKEYKELKATLESLMDSKGIDTITDKKNNLVATIKKATRETLPKSELPPHVWEQYKKVNTTYIMSVKEVVKD